MAVCPLSGEECIREKCAWFVVTESNPGGKCAVYVIGRVMGSDFNLLIQRLKEGNI